MRPQTIVAWLLSALLVSSAIAADGTRFWTWTDDTNDRSRVKGELVKTSAKGDVVSLKLNDGRSVDVAVARLSAADQRYLARWQRKQKARDEAQPKRARPLKAARPVVAGRDTADLLGMTWHMSSEKAQATARAKPGKPIFCFRVLGDLAGFM